MTMMLECNLEILVEYFCLQMPRLASGVSRVQVPPEQLFFSKELRLLRSVALPFFEA